MNARMWMKTGLSVWLGLVGGCAQVPGVQAPTADALPAAWSGQSTADAPASRWQDAGLAALQAQALRANLDLRRARLLWQRAEQQAKLNGLAYSASLGLGTSGSRPLQSRGSSGSVTVNGVQVPYTTEVGWTRNYGLNAAFGYEVDLWGRLAQGRLAGHAQSEAARADMAAARANVQAQVAEQYWRVAAAQAQQPLVEAQLDLSADILRLVRLRVDEGKELPVELDKASAQLQQARQHLATLQADRAQAQQALALLLDKPQADADLQQALLAARLPGEAPPPWLLPPPAQTLAARPDVARARLEVDAALAQLRVAQAQRYPSLSFSASVGTSGTRWQDWLSQPVGTLAANLMVPLVDWPRLALQQDLAHSDLDLAALHLRDTLMKALGDIEGQRIERERWLASLAAAQQSTKLAQDNERLASSRLAVGRLSQLDVLRVRYDLLTAQQAGLQALQMAWLNDTAMGRALSRVD